MAVSSPPSPPKNVRAQPPWPAEEAYSAPWENTLQFDSPAAYRRRICISIFWSVFINLLLIWLVLTVNSNRKRLLEERAHLNAPPPRELAKLVLMPRPPPPPPELVPKRSFLETDPSQAVAKPPENAEHYSEHNTEAAQTKVTPIKSTDTPFADGNNTKTRATESVLPNLKPTPPTPPPPPEAQPTPSKASSQPSPPPQPAQPAQPPQPPPKPLPKEGDLAMLRTPTPPEKPPAKEVKPVESQPAKDPAKEAASKATPPFAPPQPANTSSRQVLAQKSRLDGGVGRTGRPLSFNSAESPFAAYDKRVIAKIGEYFMALNRERVYGGEVAGEVEISFKLLPDGHISDVKVTHNTANSFLSALCMEVMERSAPFAPFPDAMKAIVGDYREGEIRFVY
jgi:outer membrane biosynthesis protein TonB